MESEHGACAVLTGSYKPTVMEPHGADSDAGQLVSVEPIGEGFDTSSTYGYLPVVVAVRCRMLCTGTNRPVAAQWAVYGLQPVAT